MADKLYGFTDVSFIVSACDVIKGVLYDRQIDRPCGTREKGISILLESVTVCDVIIRLGLTVRFRANCER
jgi:hypothetical protein